MPESFNAFCKIVSFTAANTKRMFDVSVASVRLIAGMSYGRGCKGSERTGDKQIGVHDLFA